MAKKATKKGGKVLGKKDLKKTKGGFIWFESAGSAAKAIGGNIGGKISTGLGSAISTNE